MKYKPIIPHLKRMFICYILEIVKMDVEIASVLKKRPILKLEEQPKDVQKLKVGLIRKEHWSVVYNRKEREVVHKSMFFLRDKHLHSTATLKIILSMAQACKANTYVDLKCFLDMVRWYLVVRSTLLNLMPRIFNTQRR